MCVTRNLLYRSELSDEFSFSPSLSSKVRAYLTHVTTQRQLNSDSKKVVFVGVHIRRTDYKTHVQRLWKGQMISKV